MNSFLCQEHHQSQAAVSERLRAIRVELFGEQGVEQLASMLSLPPKTWRHYERSVTVPAPVLLHFLELTGVDPRWLLNGQGSRFLRARRELRSSDLA